MSSVIDDIILDPLENAFDSVGAMQGELAPLKRTLIGAAVGFGVVKIFAPAVAYNADGTERPFALTNPDDKNSTYLPWWMIVAVPAVVAGVFI